MISHGVEISIPAGGSDEKDGAISGLFLLFLYHILVVKVQEIAWSASYGENRTQNPKRTNKRNFRHQIIFNWGPYRSQSPIRARNSNT